MPIDTRSAGTAWGPCIDIFAPGDSVLLPSLDANMAPTTQRWFGTSMATGYVSGAAATALPRVYIPRRGPTKSAIYPSRANATVSDVRNSMNGYGRMLYVGPTAKRTDSLTIGKGSDELLAG